MRCKTTISSFQSSPIVVSVHQMGPKCALSLWVDQYVNVKSKKNKKEQLKKEDAQKEQKNI